MSKHITVQPSSDGGMEAVASLPNGTKVSVHLREDATAEVIIAWPGRAGYDRESETLSLDDMARMEHDIRVDQARERVAKEFFE